MISSARTSLRLGWLVRRNMLGGCHAQSHRRLPTGTFVRQFRDTRGAGVVAPVEKIDVEVVDAGAGTGTGVEGNAGIQQQTQIESGIQVPGAVDESRDFYLSVLKSSSTKREAKAYLQRFGKDNRSLVAAKDRAVVEITPAPEPQWPPKPRPITDSSPATAPSSSELKGEKIQYDAQEKLQTEQLSSKARTRAYIRRLLTQQQLLTPTTFTFMEPPAGVAEFFTPEIDEEQVHVAVVKIRAVEGVEDEILRGIGRTLVRLQRLGLVSAVVVDIGEFGDAEWRKAVEFQVERVIEAVEKERGRARGVDGVCSVVGMAGTNEEEVSIAFPNPLIAPVSRGVIPVLGPVAYDAAQRAKKVDADEVVLALTRLFSFGDAERKEPDEKSGTTTVTPAQEQGLLSVDRIIYIDPLGGIPSRDRPNGSAHVFVNLEQEYEAVREELMEPIITPAYTGKHSTFRKGMPEKKASTADTSKLSRARLAGVLFRQEANVHIQNLTTLRTALAMLPAASSAVITTPEVAAGSTTISTSSMLTSPSASLSPSSSSSSSKILTAPAKLPHGRNPLIHNLLTDKPVFSSSLPISSPNSPYTTNTTLLKHGIPLNIITNPAYPSPQEKIFTLDDGTVDLPRLVYLIEDSFGRKLDLERYLQRINERVAAIIVAGEYEGAAIVTWETDGTNGQGSEGPFGRVPYLDKFAVLRKSQGAGGVADVVFKAMVMGVFPDQGIVWRSRKENVVNKWYFERAKGSWKVPDSGWTMFWTSKDGNGAVGESKEKWEQYVGICKGVESSWAE